MAQPFYQSSRSSSAYTRHLQQVSAYLHYYGGSKPQQTNFRTERQLLEENHKFIRDDDDCVDRDGTAEKEIARRYYDKLFREFALVELGRWREGMIALRWRTKDEVLSGKGQFTCASLSCSRGDDVVADPEPNGESSSRNEQASDKGRKEGAEHRLQTFELNFGYVEGGIKKNALVKVRVCQRCAGRLGEVQGATTRGKRRRSRSRDHGRSRSRRHERSPDSRRRRKEERRRCGASPGEAGSLLRHSPRSQSLDRTLPVP
ncbi:MAG: hypothetical protein M1840_004775 [Geoglossum simile]|nr:MAG: hypothetical protein M1840_004775 [Geoglossum simile]